MWEEIFGRKPWHKQGKRRFSLQILKNTKKIGGSSRIKQSQCKSTKCNKVEKLSRSNKGQEVLEEKEISNYADNIDVSHSNEQMEGRW